MPRTIQSLTAPKYKTGVGSEAPSYTPLTLLANDLLALAILGFCVFVVVEAIPHLSTRRAASLAMLLLPWSYLEVRDWTLGYSFHWAELIYAFVVVAIWALRPQFCELALLGYLVAGVALISIVIGILAPSQGILQSADGVVVTQDKTLLPRGILVGILTSGNSLGQYLVLGLPMAMLIRRRFHRVLVLALVLFALVWSAARSSLATVALTLVITGLLALLPARARGLPATVLATLPWLLVAVLPFVTTNPDAFTNRGFIWRASLQLWRGNPFFGLGSNYYTYLGQTAENIGETVFHGHNQLVQLLVTGGIMVVVLVSLMLIVGIRSAVVWAEHGSILPLAFLTMLAGVCTIEVSLVFVDNGFLLPVVVIPFAVLVFAVDAEPARNAFGPAGAQPAVPAPVGDDSPYPIGGRLG